ncbi:MAG: hypothetical protein FWC36_07760 [Spirochaetes bacterium]|nr:hypothetical protein [Spirochaetota bacterium]
MKLKTIENIRKKEKESLLYYRSDYLADAIFEYGKNSTEEKVSIEITIEKTALGESKVSVAINEHINYPMLSAIKMLKEEVFKMQLEGIFT